MSPARLFALFRRPLRPDHVSRERRRGFRTRRSAAWISGAVALGLSLGLAAANAQDPAADDEPWEITAATSYSVRSPDGSRVFGFERDVVIVHGAMTSTSFRAEYVEGSRRVVLSGQVVMVQDSTVVRAPMATYDRDERIARFPHGALVERPSGTVVADRAWWVRGPNRFELRGRAAAADTSGTIDAESMTYEAATGLFWAVGDARFTDDATGLTVTGQNLRYDSLAQLAIATGDPIATFTDDDGVLVNVTGDRLTYDPQANVAVAKGNVVLRRETLEAHAGIVRFDRDDNRAIFRESPVIVDGNTEISGERIELEMPGDGRRTVRVKGAARVANRFAGDREQPVAAPDGPEPPPDETGIPAPGEGDPELAPGGPTLERRIREAVAVRADSLRQAAPPDSSAPSPVLASPPVPSAQTVADSALAAIAALEAGTDAEEADPTPEWLTIPGDRLPEENLLFGDDVTIHFVADVLDQVTVVGHGRSKFFPNEAEGEFSEWNDVVGDTLHVWFTDAAVDSVTVLGHGVGEYRLPAGEDAMASPEVLKEKGKLVEYSAPVIRYQSAGQMMYLEQGAQVSYKTMRLTSGEIEFDPTREVMVAGGIPEPVLLDVEDQVVGSQMRYQLAAEKGEVLDGRTKFEDSYYHGDDIWKVGDDVMTVQGAAFTTCDLESPHYHFSSKQMKIYLDDKVVAKPVVLKIREIPVFALPFYMASLKKGRHSGFLLPNLELGVDDNRGRFIRNLGYYYAPNDYMDHTLSFDFYPAQERIVSYLNTRYNVRYRYGGRVALKYNRDVPNNRKDTALELSHQQTLSETMSLSGDASFLSSQDVYRDIDDGRRLDRDLRSHLTFSKRFKDSNRSLRAEVERRENLDTGALEETFPAVSFSQPSRSIVAASRDSEDGRGNFLSDVYYSIDSRFVSERSKTPDATEEDTFIEERDLGSKITSNVRTTRSFGPYLRVAPGFNGEGVWVDEDVLGNRNSFRGTYNTSLTASTNLYGTYLRPVGPAQGFRHVLEPSMSWSWAPEFREYFYVEEGDTTGTLRDRFPSFGGIGSTQRETNRMSFALRNLLQTKIGKDKSATRYDVFTLRNSISYDLLAEEEGRKPLTNLNSTLNILSALPVNQSWTVSHDPYSWDLLSTSVTTRARVSSRSFGSWGRDRKAEPAVEEGVEEAAGGDEGAPAGPAPDPATRDPDGDPRGGAPATISGPPGGEWSIDASHSARRGSTGDLSSSIVFGSRWNPTRKWAVTYDTQYDLKSGENVSQSWSVHRIVHCWQVSFDRRLLGGEWQYYLRVNVTDLPDIQAERGDSFRGRSSAGSALGGLF